MCFTETHLDSSFASEMILSSLETTIYRADHDRFEGAVMIALSPDICHRQIQIDRSFFRLEVVGVFVAGSKQRPGCVIVCLYVPPSLAKDSIAPLDDLLEYIHSSFLGQTCLVTGDFNFPDLDWNCLERSYLLRTKGFT